MVPLNFSTTMYVTEGFAHIVIVRAGLDCHRARSERCCKGQFMQCICLEDECEKVRVTRDEYRNIIDE